MTIKSEHNVRKAWEALAVPHTHTTCHEIFNYGTIPATKNLVVMTDNHVPIQAWDMSL